MHFFWGVSELAVVTGNRNRGAGLGSWGGFGSVRGGAFGTAGRPGTEIAPSDSAGACSSPPDAATATATGSGLTAGSEGGGGAAARAGMVVGAWARAVCRTLSASTNRTGSSRLYALMVTREASTNAKVKRLRSSAGWTEIQEIRPR